MVVSCVLLLGQAGYALKQSTLTQRIIDFYRDYGNWPCHLHQSVQRNQCHWHTAHKSIRKYLLRTYLFRDVYRQHASIPLTFTPRANHSCLRVSRQRHHAVLDAAICKLHVPPNAHLKSLLTHQVVTLRQLSVVEWAIPTTVHLV